MEHTQDRPIRLAELFAGSGSVRKAAEAINAQSIGQGGPVIYEVWSTDWQAFPGIDHVGNILNIRLQDLPWHPDLIWASVPCTTYSLLAIGHHRHNTQPKSDAARLGDRIVLHTLELIRQAGCRYVIENPRAVLRKMPFMRGIDRRTVTYCKYGDQVMKPTDLWSNFHRSIFLPDGLELRPICHNNNQHCHHERAPRYSTLKSKGLQPSGGTTGRKCAYERSIVPHDLCIEVLQAAHRVILQDWQGR